MDIKRPSQAKAKLRRRIVIGSVAMLLVAGITVLLARLKPAAPTVERNTVWIEPVKRGKMLRQVRGIGVLVPVEIRWIAARTEGRVERIVLRPGATVDPASVILVLTNPDVEEAVLAAESQLNAAEAELASLKVQLQSGVLAAESNATAANAAYEQAKVRAEVNDKLFADGLLSDRDLRLARVTADQLKKQSQIEEKRFAYAVDSVGPQLAVKTAEVDRLKSQAKLRRNEFEALSVRAGMRGILQLLPVEVGAQIQAGQNLARVADHTKLIAEVRVAETQARDILEGQVALIDTRNGVVQGRVSRVDPAVQNGTVAVDVELTGELPRGARPDLSVDGTIELERLEDVVFTGRPTFGHEQSTIGMFRIDTDGIYAQRVQVKLGRSSVNAMEVLAGLAPGDQVILSDTSQWDAHDRIRLK